MGNEREDTMTDEAARGTMMVCPNCDATFLATTEVCPKDGSGLIEVPDCPLLTGSDLDGRYQVGSVIGSGAMGTVYRAYQKSMDRDVAIKVLHPKYAHDPRAVKRFFREAQSASRLIHPNIVTVFDFGRSRQAHLYMVMELVEGWTLGDLIYYRAPLDVGLAASISLQVCEALSHAHGHHTVHRDLKPDNVQLTKVGDKVWAKVLDFGIARMTRPAQGAIQGNQSTIEIAGTPAYMSPEQILGKAPDIRTDLYSLGIILFEMLTASRPFEDENSVTLCMKQLNDAPPTIEDVLGSDKVPHDLARVIEQLLRKDVSDRPSTADELAKALRPFAGEEEFKALAKQLLSEVPAGLAHAPTRQDGGAALAQASAMLQAESEPESNSLSDVLARVKLNMPSPFEKPAVTACPDCGHVSDAALNPCARCGFVEAVAESGAAANDPGPRRRLVSRKGKKVATVCVLAQSQVSIDGEILAKWASEKRDAGHDVRVQSMALFVDYIERGPFKPADAEPLVRELLQFAKKCREARLGVRVGFALASRSPADSVSEDARRLAGVAPVGGVVIPSVQQGTLKIRARPLTDTYLPSGEPLRCAVVTEGQTTRSKTSEVLLYGRSAALRRLGQLRGEGGPKGLRQIVLTGERGVGKTAVLREFAADMPHVFLRVAPLGIAWPGHTIARLVLKLLGGGDERSPKAVKALYADLPDRTRTLLDVLLMREALPAVDSTSWLTASELAASVYGLMRTYAKGASLLLVLDDIHCLDPASRMLLDELIALCRHEDWLLVGAGPQREVRSTLRLKEWQDFPLRPLGLRAATQLLESLGAPRARLGLLAEISGGNPLAIHLLAKQGPHVSPCASKVVDQLLPETLQGLSSKAAEEAWSSAVYGADEKNDLAIRAARMYLELAPTPRIREWLTSRVQIHGGIYSDLSCGWKALTREHLLLRAQRHESLGLFELAEAEFLNASRYHLKTQGVWERIEAARMRARNGDGEGATSLYREAIEIGLTVAHTSGLVALGASLLTVGQDSAASEVLEMAKRGIVRTQGTRLESGRLWALLARCTVRQNDGEKAMEYLTHSKELVDELRNDDARAARLLEALVQEIRAEIATAEGDADAARFNLRQASDAFRDLGIMGSATRALLMLGQVELDIEEYTRAADTFKACVTLSLAQGLVREAGLAQVGCGAAMLRIGQAEEGTQLLRSVLRGRRVAQFEATNALGYAMLQRGLKADAARYGDRARTLAGSDGQRARALLLLSKSQESFPQALRYLDEGRRLLRSSGNGVLLRTVARDSEGSLESEQIVTGGSLGVPSESLL
jgi:serine/threonine protein kinase/tetratricopeptide (TPR) repeat protein